MGRYKSGINGPFSGKIGSVIGSHWRGVDYMKSLSGNVAKPPTYGQLNQRRRFAEVSSWLKPIKELIWIGYQAFGDKKTPMNEAISFNLKNAVIADAESSQIDFPKAIFSRGELLISLIREVLALPKGVLVVKWEDASSSALCNDSDLATFIVYNPAKEQFITFQDVVARAAKEVSLQMPKDFAGDAVHCYMHYVNAYSNAVSTTVYVGEVTAY